MEAEAAAAEAARNTESTLGGPGSLSEHVIVTGRRLDYSGLMPYGGLSGSEENFFRDASFAMSSPEERAAILGMNPFAEAGELRDENGPSPDNFYTINDNGEAIAISPVRSNMLRVAGVSTTWLVPSQFNHIVNEHSGLVPSKGVFNSQLLTNLSTFQRSLIGPALNSVTSVTERWNGTRLDITATLPFTVGLGQVGDTGTLAPTNQVTIGLTRLGFGNWVVTTAFPSIGPVRAGDYRITL
jgi:hypothetical protein